MSQLDLMIDSIDGRLHAAIVDRTGLYDLHVDPVTMNGEWASIYLGKVTKIDKKLNAAIVDLGQGLYGFLAAKHTLSSDNRPATAATSISDHLSPGQSILVQIKSEGKAKSASENAKMPRLTMKLHMMGHCLQHTPLSPAIQNEPRHPELAAWLKPQGGWVLRAPVEKTDSEKTKQEAAKLLADWASVKDIAAQMTAPGLIKRGPNAIERTIADYGLNAFGHIHAASKSTLKLVIEWCEKFDPTFATSKRLRLFRPEKPLQKLFDIHDIYATLEELTDSVTLLPSGGSIVIEPTTALTVVDVNLGNCDNIITCNLEAVRELARQIRIRNLSGALLVDFINMNVKSDRAQLLNAIESALFVDPVMNACHGFTRLGIIEITRKRRDANYAEKQAS